MENESERIARLWEEVQDSTGVQTGHPSQEIPFWEAMAMGRNMALHPRLGLGYTPGFSDGLTDDEVRGSIAHELGHLGQTKPSRLGEIRADKFAAKHGYGNQLISALQTMNIKGSDREHPPIEERVKIIRSAMPQSDQMNLDLAA